MSTVHVDDADAVWGLVAWEAISIGIMGFGLFFTWQPLWWGFLRKHTMLPHHNIIFCGYMIFAALQGWGMWRFWYFINCNVNHVVPVLFAVMMLSFGAYFPLLMLATMPIFPFISSVISIGFSIAYFVYAFAEEQSLTGIMGVVAFVVGILPNFLLSIHLLLHTNFYVEYASEEPKKRQQLKDISHGKKLTSDSESPVEPSPQEQTATGSQFKSMQPL